MRPSSKPTEPAADATPLPAPSFPAIEKLLESGSADEIRSLFSSVKSGLEQLKGPKAEQAKKVHAAIGSAEELLGVLLETRESMAASSKGRR